MTDTPNTVPTEKPKRYAQDAREVRDHARLTGLLAARAALGQEEATLASRRLIVQWLEEHVKVPRSIHHYWWPILLLVVASIGLWLNDERPGPIRGVLGVVALIAIVWMIVIRFRENKDWAQKRTQLAEELTQEAISVYEAERTNYGQRPQPLPYGVGHEGAEALVRDWMKHFGVVDAEVTRYSADGGIDVESRHYVAQVKNYAGAVTVESVRALYGVAAAHGKRALFFTSGRLTAEGLAFAERAGMAVFHYDAVAGTITGLNGLGVRAVENSIPAALPPLQ